MKRESLQAPLVMPQETERIYQHLTVEKMIAARGIAHTYATKQRISLANQPLRFFELLAVVYEAGRIQGIREQRKKRRDINAVF